MLAVQKESRTIGDFLTYMEVQGFVICESHETARGERWEPTRLNVEQLIAKHFEIDLNVCERERGALLASLRA